MLNVFSAPDLTSVQGLIRSFYDSNGRNNGASVAGSRPEQVNGVSVRSGLPSSGDQCLEGATLPLDHVNERRSISDLAEGEQLVGALQITSNPDYQVSESTVLVVLRGLVELEETCWTVSISLETIIKKIERKAC